MTRAKLRALLDVGVLTRRLQRDDLILGLPNCREHVSIYLSITLLDKHLSSAIS